MNPTRERTLLLNQCFAIVTSDPRGLAKACGMYTERRPVQMIKKHLVEDARILFVAVLAEPLSYTTGATLSTLGAENHSLQTIIIQRVAVSTPAFKLPYEVCQFDSTQVLSVGSCLLSWRLEISRGMQEMQPCVVISLQI